ncbi:MAG: hypothetical protein JWP74_639 [Marmoricola sp.]|nr:hypothetical protein [Marmoricola sp.]
MRVLGPRRGRTPALLAAAALGLSVLVGSGAAVAGHHHGPQAVQPPPAAPSSASQIQNIDQVKTAIKGYYGDEIDPTRVNPIDGTPLHTFNPDGNYAHEVGGIVRSAKKTLAFAKQQHPNATHRAVLFDVDDTLLNTYPYEIYSNFVYNPTSNAAFVNGDVFRAVPHMVSLEKKAEKLGYTVFFLTGRPETQRSGTIANLTGEGYDVTSSHLFLKDYGVDTWLGSCASACTTTQYKSLTRKHIEKDLGYRIVGNFGDQYSDLLGGYANRTFKLPNPMYYLP